MQICSLISFLKFEQVKKSNLYEYFYIPTLFFNKNLSFALSSDISFIKKNSIFDITFQMKILWNFPIKIMITPTVGSIELQSFLLVWIKNLLFKIALYFQVYFCLQNILKNLFHTFLWHLHTWNVPFLDFCTLKNCSQVRDQFIK